MLANLSPEVTKTQMLSLLGGILSGVSLIFCSINLLASLPETCPSYFFAYFSLVSLSLCGQFYLGYKIPKVDLYTPEIRKKYKRGLCAVFPPMLSFGFFAIIWWNKERFNPLYCMFGDYLNLPYTFGLFLQIIAFLYFVHFVSVLHAYTKRKYYLLSIGGVANQEIRLAAQREHRLVRISILQNNNRDYIVFEDQFQDMVELPEEQLRSLTDIQQAEGESKTIECPICLIPLDKGNNISKGKNCTHYYHAKCIKTWLHRQRQSVCPVCRQSFR